MSVLQVDEHEEQMTALKQLQANQRISDQQVGNAVTQPASSFFTDSVFVHGHMLSLSRP